MMAIEFQPLVQVQAMRSREYVEPGKSNVQSFWCERFGAGRIWPVPPNAQFVGTRRSCLGLRFGRRSHTLPVTNIALRCVENPIDHWLPRDGWRLARLAGYAKSFLILRARHLLAGGGPSAVPLGARDVRTAQLPCGG